MTKTINGVTPPRKETHSEWLRYLVQSSSPDNPSLKFLANLYSYCLSHEGITDKQIEALEPYYDKAADELFEAGWEGL